MEMSCLTPKSIILKTRGSDSIKMPHFPTISESEARVVCPASLQISAQKLVTYPMPQAFKAILTYDSSMPWAVRFCVNVSIGFVNALKTIISAITAAVIISKSERSGRYCRKSTPNTAVTIKIIKILKISIFKDQTNL